MKGSIEGQVLERTGDFMPPASTGRRIARKTKVLVFQPPVTIAECRGADEVTHFQNLAGFIYVGSRKPSVEVETNERGEFSVDLEPGEYSIFVQYGRWPYINFANGKGYVGYVQVKAGRTAQLDLTVNRATD